MLILFNDVLKILLCKNLYFIDLCWFEIVLLEEKSYFYEFLDVCLIKFFFVLVKGGLFCCY